ncbi:hypothetical protein, partial [Variovorax sp. 67-131]
STHYVKSKSSQKEKARFEREYFRILLGQVVYLSNSSGGDLTVTVRIDSNINPGNAYPQIRSFPVPAHQDVEIGCSKYATGVGLQVLTYNIISY